MKYKKNLVENGICLQQNVPGTSQLSKCCVHNLGFTYKKLKQIPIETSSYNIQRKFENYILISSKNPKYTSFLFMKVV